VVHDTRTPLLLGRTPTSRTTMAAIVLATTLVISLAVVANANGVPLESLSRQELIERVRSLEATLATLQATGSGTSSNVVDNITKHRGSGVDSSSDDDERHRVDNSGIADHAAAPTGKMWPELMPTPFMMWNGW
jgi:hypothetical protein